MNTRVYNVAMEKAPKVKEFFYLGLAHTKKEGFRILKIGTTNNLQRRAQEHRRKKDYKEENFSLYDFEYLQTFQLSHSNTLLLEDSVRAQLRKMSQVDEQYKAKDRFIIMHNDEIQLNITIRAKTYHITIPAVGA